MYDPIVFPTDGSEAADAALSYAFAVADYHDATLHALHVADTNQDSLTLLGDEVVDVLEREGERIVEAVAEDALLRDVSVETAVEQGDPAMTIVDYAEAVDAGAIAMATHGRSGLDRVLLGSVTERVAESAAVPVLTVAADLDWDPAYPPGTVLVATDGSAGGDGALASGIDVALATGAKLAILTVVESGVLDAQNGDDGGPATDRARETVEAAVATAEDAGVGSVEGTVAHGRAYREIGTHAEETGADLVAVGTQGQSGFGRHVLGGVTGKLLRSAPTPVLVAPAAADE
jgi:nucleotide-binding universal stress UspA family protein